VDATASRPVVGRWQGLNQCWVPVARTLDLCTLNTVCLLRLVDASKYNGTPHGLQRGECVVRLKRELVHQRNDQHAWALACTAGGEDPGERGNAERQCLAAARLSDADNVLSGECMGPSTGHRPERGSVR